MLFFISAFSLSLVVVAVPDSALLFDIFNFWLDNPSADLPLVSQLSLGNGRAFGCRNTHGRIAMRARRKYNNRQLFVESRPYTPVLFQCFPYESS